MWHIVKKLKCIYKFNKACLWQYPRNDFFVFLETMSFFFKWVYPEFSSVVGTKSCIYNCKNACCFPAFFVIISILSCVFEKMSLSRFFQVHEKPCLLLQLCPEKIFFKPGFQSLSQKTNLRQHEFIKNQIKNCLPLGQPILI